LATLAIFEEDNVLAVNRGKAERMTAALAPLAAHAKVRHFRQRGMIWAFDAVSADAQAAATFSRRFFSTALEHELLLRPIGQTVYLMPPFVMDDEEIDVLAAGVQTVFEKVVAG
jgi:adenosylmethionine-8-amino-7-oxononanoate aminotransferase